MEKAWIEFKTTLLPWILAGGVIALMLYQDHRSDAILVKANQDQAAVMHELGDSLDGIRELLGTQGYISVPTHGSGQ